MIKRFPKAERGRNPVASAKKILGWYDLNVGSIPRSRIMLHQDMKQIRNFTRRIKKLERKPNKTQEEKERLLKWRRMLKSALFDASVGINKLKLSE